MIKTERRMNHTSYRVHREDLCWHKDRSLTRSFDTLEEAERFAEGKDVTDIYIKNGRYTVEWIKSTRIE